jgi:hypothetical protein
MSARAAIRPLQYIPHPCVGTQSADLSHPLNPAISSVSSPADLRLARYFWSRLHMPVGGVCGLCHLPHAAYTRVEQMPNSAVNTDASSAALRQIGARPMPWR